MHPEYTPEFLARFWTRVDRGADCWRRSGWTRSGYSRLEWNGQAVSAHRVAWELASGILLSPDDCVLHTCDARRCVRNDDPGTYEVNGILLPRFGHLYLGTDVDNNRDRARKGRSADMRGERSPNAKLTDAEVEVIWARGLAGETQRAIAEDYGVSQLHVSRILRGRSWSHASRAEYMPQPHPELVKRGENNPHAKLTPALIRAIRLRYATGQVRLQDVADEFHTSLSNVSGIVRRTRWAHID